MEQFRKLGISEPVLKSIQELKFEKPSEIQEKSIPLILDGKDVIAGAATGSGKTLVFASGIIKSVERGKNIQALILTPTRELAEQVSRAVQRFSQSKSLEIIPVYGGVAINPQIYNLRTADVVVGTPGRILDHLSRGTINLDSVKILVLDEADRMLDMGFKDDVEKIIEECPVKRQTLLFSATIFGEVSNLAKKYMKDPVEVSAEAYVDPSKLAQVYYDVEDNQKFSLLVHFLRHEKSKLAMVFCNTKRNTDFVADNLSRLGVNAVAIHGGHSQGQRNRSMRQFSSQEANVLVCTDVAARGLDIKGVSHIYNYDIPKDSKDYIHRIGRTARAGKEGKVINIVARRDDENFNKVIRDHDTFDIAKEEMPRIEKIFIRFRDHNAGRGGFERGNFSRRDNFRRGNDFGRRGGGGQGYGGRNYGGGGDGRRFSNPSNFHRRKDYGGDREISGRGRRPNYGREGEQESENGYGDYRRSRNSRNFSRNNYGSRGRY